MSRLPTGRTHNNANHRPAYYYMEVAYLIIIALSSRFHLNLPADDHLLGFLSHALAIVPADSDICKVLFG